MTKDNLGDLEWDAGFPFGKTSIREIIRLCGLHAKSPFSEVFEFYTPDYAEKAIQALLHQQELEVRKDEEILTLTWVLNQFTFTDPETDQKYIEDRLATLKGKRE